MVQVSQVYNNREKNNVLKGREKRAKKCHICVAERVKYLKIFS